MANVSEEDGLGTSNQTEIEELTDIETRKRTALEEISYCLSIAKRLLDIELGRISR